MHTDWLAQMDKIARPVFENLAKGQLVAQLSNRKGFKGNTKAAALEAVGRSFCGISGFLGREQIGQAEVLRKQYIDYFMTGIERSIEQDAPDFLFPKEIGQILVDASFLAMGLLESYDQIWVNLSSQVKTRLIHLLKQTRAIKPGFNNWLLFSAMIETFLFKVGENDFDKMRMDYALTKHSEWYLGDGVYGDGPQFHFDYYNSFVIQPYLLRILETVEGHFKFRITLEDVLLRAKRYAQIQEKLIMPDGKFPIIGRSMAYRLGAFQHLSYMAYKKLLPDSLSEGQVRCALTAVKNQLFGHNGNFDSEGWLTPGFNGCQEEILDNYISAGSPYLTLMGFWHLGLNAEDSFWVSKDAPWSSVLGWGGSTIMGDKAL